MGGAGVGEVRRWFPEFFDRINRIDRISDFFDRRTGFAGWTGGGALEIL